MKNRGLPELHGYMLVAVLVIPLAACDSLHHWATQAAANRSTAANINSATHIPEYLATNAAADKASQELLEKAQLAMRQANYDEAERHLAALLQLQPQSIVAIQGMEQIQIRKKHAALIAQAQELLASADDKTKSAKVEQAMSLLHTVLIQNPKQATAAALYQSLQQEQQAQRLQASRKLVFAKPVSMAFRDSNLKMIFESLSRMTGINFILDKDVSSEAKATLFVKNMDFNDALDLLLRTNQLEKKVLGEKSAIIFTNDVMHQREYKDMTVRSFVLDYADAKQMSALLRSMLNIKSMEIDARLNTLMIKDSPEVLALAEKIINAQDKPDPEVMLEVQIIELQRSQSRDLGVNPPTGLSVIASGSNLTLKDLKSLDSSGVGVNSGDNGVGLSFGGGIVDVNLLANPRIRVKNRENAKIHIGQKVPVITSNVSTNGVQSQSVQYIDAGLKLEVEPVISYGDDVTIKLSLNVGSIGSSYTVSSGTAPIVGTRFTGTTLRLHDGETQVLAGLIDDQDRKNMSGIAGLLNMPLLGRLFGSESLSKAKTEIVLSITPRIVRPRTMQTPEEAEIWVGPDLAGGKAFNIPMIGANGETPFSVPKPPPANNTKNKSDEPQTLNIPLPPGFSLGDGLISKDSAAASKMGE